MRCHFYSLLTVFAVGCANIETNGSRSGVPVESNSSKGLLSISYSGNNNTGGIPPLESGRFQSGAQTTVLGAGTLSKSNAIFVEWNTNPDGSGTAFLPGNLITVGANDILLFAIYQNLSSVVYMPNSSTGGAVPVDSAKYAPGTSALAMSPGTLFRTGATFLGWNTAPDGSGITYLPGASMGIGTSDLVVFAIYQDLVSIVYYGNNNTSGQAPVDPAEYAPGTQAIVMVSGDLAKTGASFVSWNTAADGTGVTYAPGSQISISASGMNLYAIYQASVLVPRNWKGVASSYDGTKLVAIESGGRIYTSSNSGLNWASHGPSLVWTGISSSADGANLTAVAYNEKIYRSSDYGVTWTAATAPVRNWTSITSSYDGVYLAAVESGALVGGNIYTSNDSGQSWSIQDYLLLGHWTSIASSGGGKYLISARGSNGVSVSADWGKTWVNAGLDSSPWDTVTISGTGNRYFATSANGPIFSSADSGTSWVGLDAKANWSSMASASDASLIAAAAKGGKIYISSDYGSSWVPRATNQSWISIACSGDGAKLIAAAANGNIFISEDFGQKWTPMY